MDKNLTLNQKIKKIKQLKREVQVGFQRFQEGCDLTKIIWPAPGDYDACEWTKCTSPNHVFHRASVSICSAKYCPKFN
jgi:hypothetical protein